MRRRLLFVKTIILMSAASFFIPCALAKNVMVCQTEKAKYTYRIQLANLILSKTAPEYGPSAVIPYYKKDPTQPRSVLLLKEGKVDLLYLSPTKKLLEETDVIKIDIHNGMLGYRVFIIRKEDRDKFSRINTLDDLRQFKGGFGSQWGDFKIFALNRLPVVGAVSTHTLLNMLDKNRFDYFHRGLHEAWAELEKQKERFPDLVVEETLALVYDFPVYFVFSKANRPLKKRFEKGFNIILNDGSFKELYLKNFGGYAKKAKLNSRKILRINYPIPEGLPPVNTKLWLN